jgi:hypothetical protein
LLYLRVGYPCNNIYYSDGTGAANHVQIVNNGTYDFLGGGCRRADSPGRKLLLRDDGLLHGQELHGKLH